MTTWDAIVLGVGGFGGGALRHLARAGHRVLGIERFGIGHDRGSSHGETRIIRQAYFEHPNYVPLLFRAYDLWHELERETGRPLFHQVGLFIAGRPDCESVAGTLLAAREHRLPVDQLTAAQARQRFPGYRFPDEFQVVFEAQAGYLAVEACVAAQIESAVRHGAQLHTEETVLSFTPDGDGVRVQTDKGDYRAARLIVTAGPWAASLLAGSQAPAGGLSTEESQAVWRDRLQVVRKPVFWFEAGPQFDVSQGNSTFFFETEAGQFYGFPRIDGRTIKMAEHTHGDSVDDPLTVNRELHAGDLASVADFLAAHLPGIVPRPVKHSVCMYTRTPDCHFVVDRVPNWPAVTLGAGFSGHGFKFTPVIGQALAELAMNGATSLPVEFLSLARLSPGG